MGLRRTYGHLIAVMAFSTKRSHATAHAMGSQGDCVRKQLLGAINFSSCPIRLIMGRRQLKKHPWTVQSFKKVNALKGNKSINTQLQPTICHL